jgi:hypothetical protein
LTKKYVVAYLSRNRLLNIPGAKSSDGFIAGAMPLLLVFAQIQNGLKEYKVEYHCYCCHYEIVDYVTSSEKWNLLDEYGKFKYER